MGTDNVVRVMFEAVTDKFNAQLQGLKDSVANLGAIGTQAGEEAGNGFKKAGEQAVKSLNEAGEAVAESLNEAGEKAGESFGEITKKAGDAVKKAGEEVTKGISEVARQAGESLNEAGKKAGRPLSEILAIGGELQATMSGSEAATQFSAFLRSVAKAGEKLGLNFVDANNQLKSIPEIIDIIRWRYGELDAMETLQLTEAFGTKEAVDMINLLYDKTSDVVDKTVELERAMKEGSRASTEMAEAMNEGIAEKSELLKQKISNIFERLGEGMQESVSRAYDNIFRAIDEFVANGSLDRMAESLGRIIELFSEWFGRFLERAPDMLESLANGLEWVSNNIFGVAKALAILGMIKGGLQAISGLILAIYGGPADKLKGAKLIISGLTTTVVSGTALYQINQMEKETKAGLGKMTTPVKTNKGAAPYVPSTPKPID